MIIEKLFEEIFAGQLIKIVPSSDNGYISKCYIVELLNQKLFVKANDIYLSEQLSYSLFPKIIKLVYPISLKIEKIDGFTFHILNYIDMVPIQDFDDFAKILAEFHNNSAGKKCGFPCDSFAGFTRFENGWRIGWKDYFIDHKLEIIVQKLLDEIGQNNELSEKWPMVKARISKVLSDVDNHPVLLHGDLWTGNIGQTKDNDFVMFDPSSFYGHYEFDLASLSIFQPIPGPIDIERFLEIYHQYSCFERKCENERLRYDIYHLFYYINHWLHFGTEEFIMGTMKLINNLSQS